MTSTDTSNSPPELFAEYHDVIGQLRAQLIDQRDLIDQMSVALGDATDHQAVPSPTARDEVASVFQTTSDFIFAKDADLAYTCANPAMARLLERTVSEIVGATDLELFEQDVALVLGEDDLLVLAGGAVDRQQTLPINGAIRTFHIIKKPLIDDDGHIIGLFGIARDVTDRLRAEYERDRFFELSLDMLCLAGIDGYFKSVNPAFEKTLGYTREELLARPFLDFIHPDDVESTLEQLALLSKGESTVNFENRYRCKNGEYKWLLWTCPGVSAEADLLFAVARDISDIKKANEALEISESRFRTAFDMAPIAMVLASRRGFISRVNQQTEALLGYDADELVGRYFAVITHPDDVESGRAHVARLMNRQADRISMEKRYVRKDGSTIWAKTTISAMRDEAGNDDQLIAQIVDITAEKKAADALAASERRFRSYFELGLIGIAIVSPDDEWITFNDEICRMSGYCREELEQMSWQVIMHPDDLEPNHRAFEAMERHEIDHVKATIRYVRKDGRVITTNTSVRTVFDEVGRPDYSIAMIQDITDRVAIEEDLRFRLDLESLIARLSTRFIDMDVDSIDGAIGEALRETAEFTHADRACILQFDFDRKVKSLTHEWCDPSLDCQCTGPRKLPLMEMPWLMPQLHRGQTVHLPDIGSMTEEMSEERAYFSELQLKSLLLVPLMLRGRLIGALRYDAIRGQRAWDEGQAALLRIAADMFAGAIERQRIERELRESEERHRLIVDGVNCVTWEYDTSKRRFTFVSKHAERLLGFSRAQWSAPDFWRQRIHPEDLDWVEAYYEQQINAGAEQNLEYRVRAAQGSTIWIKESASIVSSDGATHLLRGVFVDITDRKRVESALIEVVRGVAPATGAKLFPLITQHIARAVNADAVILGELVPGPEDRIRTLSFFADGQHHANLTYDLEGTPCQKIVNEKACCYPDDVQSLFPNDQELRELDARGYIGVPLTDTAEQPLGLIAALFRQPIEKPTIVQSMLIIFAIRAQAEMERLRDVENLRTREQRSREMAVTNRRLLDEVNHRVRNNLGQLRTLLTMTGRQARDKEDFASTMESHLLALANIHGLLAEAQWEPTDLRTIISHLCNSIQSVLPHTIEWTMTGPPVGVASNQVTPLAMTFHELLANSQKYGAHRTAEGRLAIDWSTSPQADGKVKVILNWRETSDLPVTPPNKPSLGTSLLEGFIGFELGGRCELHYPATGANHTLTFFLEDVRPDAANT